MGICIINRQCDRNSSLYPQTTHTKEKTQKIGKDAKYRQNPLWKSETKLKCCTHGTPFTWQRSCCADPLPKLHLHSCPPPKACEDSVSPRLLLGVSRYPPTASPELSSCYHSSLCLSNVPVTDSWSRARKLLTLFYWEIFTEILLVALSRSLQLVGEPHKTAQIHR